MLTDQVWDPLSSSQTSRLVAFMRRLIRDYPTVLHGDNRNTQVREQTYNVFYWSDIKILLLVVFVIASSSYVCCIVLGAIEDHSNANTTEPR